MRHQHDNMRETDRQTGNDRDRETLKEIIHKHASLIPHKVCKKNVNYE